MSFVRCHFDNSLYFWPPFSTTRILAKLFHFCSKWTLRNNSSLTYLSSTTLSKLMEKRPSTFTTRRRPAYHNCRNFSFQLQSTFTGSSTTVMQDRTITTVIMSKCGCGRSWKCPTRRYLTCLSCVHTCENCGWDCTKIVLNLSPKHIYE